MTQPPVIETLDAPTLEQVKDDLQQAHDAADEARACYSNARQSVKAGNLTQAREHLAHVEAIHRRAALYGQMAARLLAAT